MQRTARCRGSDEALVADLRIFTAGAQDTGDLQRELSATCRVILLRKKGGEEKGITAISGKMEKYDKSKKKSTGL